MIIAIGVCLEVSSQTRSRSALSTQMQFWVALMPDPSRPVSPLLPLLADVITLTWICLICSIRPIRLDLCPSSGPNRRSIARITIRVTIIGSLVSTRLSNTSKPLTLSDVQFLERCSYTSRGQTQLTSLGQRVGWVGGMTQWRTARPLTADGVPSVQSRSVQICSVHPLFAQSIVKPIPNPMTNLS